MDFPNNELLIYQQSHNNRSPQNQQTAHNYNRNLCSGRRQRGRNETFLQTTKKEVDKYNKSDSLIISGDLNTRF